MLASILPQMAASRKSRAPAGLVAATSEPPMADAGETQSLSPQQAHQAAYRLVARYYEYERIVPILRLVRAISWTEDHPDPDERAWAVWAVWQDCVQETLDGAPLPELPPPWDS
jgi:hypothetical protein